MTTRSWNSPAPVRPPMVAGMFYPADPEELRSELNDLFSRANPPAVDGTIVGLVAPHAGYPYSGLTAAHAYALLKNRNFSTVVIVSPSHREYFKGISVYPGTAYRTPFGEIPIDAALREKLTTNDPIIEASGRGHSAEHAIEVQLPFLQQVLGKAMILPVVMGDQDAQLCIHLGNRLAETTAGNPVLLIASSDLSHYHSQKDAGVLDDVVQRNILGMDVEKFLADLDAGKGEACGGGPIAAVMTAVRRLSAGNAAILHRSDSGQTTGDTRSVVGYISAAFYRKH